MCGCSFFTKTRVGVLLLFVGVVLIVIGAVVGTLGPKLVQKAVVCACVCGREAHQSSGLLIHVLSQEEILVVSKVDDSDKYKHWQVVLSEFVRFQSNELITPNKSM